MERRDLSVPIFIRPLNANSSPSTSSESHLIASNAKEEGCEGVKWELGLAYF